ncbi:uncharacterized protein B0P05DRAFT_524518 [Gilbertella persicaria]|uniref:uncharacterized protein n=1 Tax=Gilbertella persicaria TaxID=101096 RepID=UPI002220905D|nr:uncharacterized protein B0P05DRAFT_524518 [Gilbertella persicaria]KAI8095054.1 hypothetical protein B0P05DRAFT_524518 [Gilbertella persicaria]
MSMATTEAGFDDPTDFKTTKLQILDEHLRCPICKELFNTTMILSTCSHSFCALCIRRSLSTEQKCPKCRKEAVEKNLIHNYDLDNVVRSWKDSRHHLLTLDKEDTMNVDQVPSNQVESISIQDSEDEFQSQPSTRRSTRLSSQTKLNYAEPQLQEQSIMQPQLQHPPLKPVAPQSPKEIELNRTSMVVCPICQQQMAFGVLDIHVDRCLKGDRSIPVLNSNASGSNAPPTHSLPIMRKKASVNLGPKPIKQVFGVMKDKEIKALLRSLNLPDHGDRKQMMWRHTEYVTMWNANNDSENPVSAHVLIQRLQKMESSMLAEKNNQLKRKNEDLNSHKQHYKDDYVRLIEDVKRRK